MAGDLDAYRASEEFFETSSTRRRRQREHQPRNKRLLSMFSLIFLIGVIVAVALVLRKAGSSGDSSNSSPPTGSAHNATATDSTAVPAPNPNASSTPSDACATRRPPPHQRTVAFWQSEVNGCEQVPAGVTHIIFGFSLVGSDGRAAAMFQNTDDEIRDCVKVLRKSCIAILGSIGGSTNNDAIANVADPEAFAESAVALVEAFGFDGVDIDDETTGPQFNASRVVAFVRATRAALDAKDKTLLLTYDTYFNEGDPSFCTNPAYAAYSRCFPTILLESLDWVNIMAYNVAQDPQAAAGIYENALNTTFAAWRTQLNGDFTKATIGICVDKSCAYGPGPSASVIASWNEFARTSGQGGGMMVYAASGEVETDFNVTRSVISVQA